MLMGSGNFNGCIDGFACPQAITADAWVAIQEGSVALYFALLAFNVTAFWVKPCQPIVEA